MGKLREKLSRGGLKALVGNRGWRKYLRVRGAEAEIDEGALKREARYDGKAVCFLALLLEVELERRLREQGVGASFREVLRDLKRVKGEAVPGPHGARGAGLPGVPGGGGGGAAAGGGAVVGTSA